MNEFLGETMSVMAGTNGYLVLAMISANWGGILVRAVSICWSHTEDSIFPGGRVIQ